MSYRNRFPELGEKPRILKVHHYWVCASMHARGEGLTPRVAYAGWQRALDSYRARYVRTVWRHPA